MAVETGSEQLSIRDVSIASGLSAHTLRYYERIGLMEPVARNASGHRRYTDFTIEWVILLRHLRSTGMSIADMLRFAELVRGGPETVPDRLDLLKRHRREILERIDALQSTLTVLDRKIDTYERGDAITPQQDEMENQ